MSGFSNSGMADSWSAEVAAPLTTAGNGGCRTYCANCDGGEASFAAVAGWVDSAEADCSDNPGSVGDAAKL